jgi:prephenate dehydrogenase
MGLALREAGVASAVVGHDKEPAVHGRAKKLGAVDRTDWNLISACEKSDLVLLATPAGAIEETLQAIGPYLRSGCVVMDTASLMSPVLDWAADTLPEQVHFVGGNPIISAVVEGEGGLEAARADLFQNSLFCLAPAPDADPAAVKLASDLVMILGAKPVFFDPAEHDGLLAGMEHLPVLLSLAMLETVVRQPSWRELRKVAGSSFEISTRLAWMGTTDYSDAWFSNRDNVLRWLDAFSASLDSIRQTLVEGQQEEFVQRSESALVERYKWMHDREQGQWEGEPAVEMPDRGNVLADAFLGGWWRRGRDKDK